MHVSITLSPEAFSQLLAVNWKDKFLLFTASMKYPAVLPDKLPVDPNTHFHEPVILPIALYNIDWEEQPGPKEQVKECTDKFSKQLPARTTIMDLSVQDNTDTLASAKDNR